MTECPAILFWGLAEQRRRWSRWRGRSGVLVRKRLGRPLLYGKDDDVQIEDACICIYITLFCQNLRSWECGQCIKYTVLLYSYNNDLRDVVQVYTPPSGFRSIEIHIFFNDT